MNNIKKTICLMLSLVIVSAFVVPVAAAEKQDLPATGLIWDTWKSYLRNMDETTLRALSTQRPGDVNADGRISASDARLCLRAAADLETLTESQHAAADVDKSTDVSASDARKVLRAAAGLDVLEDLSIDTTLDWGIVIGPLKGSGSGRYFWQCSTDRAGLTVTQESITTPDGKDGASPETFFVFTPEKPGKYTVTFQLTTSAQDTVLDEFQMNLLVNDSITVSQGEQLRVDGLKNAGSGRYNWQCTVTPDTGIEVQESIANPDNTADGAPAEQVFTFTAAEKGSYQAHFELIASGEATAINEFYLDITVE